MTTMSGGPARGAPGPRAPEGRAGYGRDAQLGQVRTLLARAQQGAGGVLLVDGEPGSGKSALLLDAVGEAAGRGFSLAVGAADRLGAAVPFFALRSALGEPFATAAIGHDGREPADLGASVGLLRDHLERRAAAAPVLVCLDDLQWAGPGTLAALRILPRTLRRQPVAWLLAWSSVPEGTGSHLPGILARDGADRVTLGPLGPDAVTAMLTAAFGAPPGRALANLAAGAGGSPSLAAELVGGLRDEDAVRVAGGRAELVSDRLPGRIHHLARRRLDAVGVQARHLLMTAAVLGRDSRLADLAEMLGQVPAVLLPAVGEAVRAALVTADGDAFAFRHELLRRAVGELVPEPAARALHRHYGEILLAREGPAERAAAHLLRAAHPAERASLARLDEAVARTMRPAPRTAADLAVRALELTPAAGREALPRTVAAVEALAAAGALGRAAEIARDTLIRPLPAVAEARLRCALSAALCAGGLAAEADDQARLALDLPRLPGEVRDQALSARLQALIGLDQGSLGRAAGDALAGRRDGHAAVAALVARAVVSWRGGLVGDAVELLRDAAGSAAAVPGDARHVPAPLVLAAALIDLRELGEAADVLRAADRGTARRGPSGAVLSLLHARVHLAAGRLDEAAGDAGTALAAAGDGDADGLAAVAHCVLSAVELRRGDLTAAGDHLARRAVTGPQFAELYARTECATAAVRLTEARDGAPAVAGDLRRLCAGLPSGGGLLAGDPALPAWLARAALAAGDRELAAGVARAVLALAGAHPGLTALAAAAAHCQGIVSADAARLAEAAAGHPDRWARASAAEDLGVLRASQGNAAEAVRYLQEALGGYGEARADRDQARVRGRLRRLGIRRRHWTARPARPLTGWDSLTETEQAVARLVAQGLNNRQVGARMFISGHTVAHYLRQAFRKLGIGSRVELTRIVLEQAGH